MARKTDQTPKNTDVVIERDPDYRAQLLEALRLKMGVGERRTGVHVSDLITCVRKGWAERVLGFTQNYPDSTILTWSRGLAHEEVTADGIQQVQSGWCFQCQRNWAYGDMVIPAKTKGNPGGYFCRVCGSTLLTGTIDWITDEGFPVENKSTMKSSRKHLDEGEMAWYVDQVKTYMAFHDKSECKIAIFHINGDYSRKDEDIRNDGPEPELVTYRITWRSPIDRLNWLTTMARKKELYEGDSLPPLDSNSPAHPDLCVYCAVGERLPNGSECERWPWELAPSGQYVRKGSGKGLVVGLDDMMAELLERQNEITDTQLEAST